MPWRLPASPNRWRGIALVIASLLVLPVTSHAERGKSRGAKVHQVRQGQTLSAIAQRYGLTVDDLAAANKLNPERPLSVGRELKLPRSGSGHFHVVRSGETAAQIAKSEGCSVAEITRLNKLGRSARLDVGQILKLPQSSSGASTRGSTRVKGRRHTVKSGESLNEIAHAYGIGTKILMRANKIRNPKALSPGRSLIIPDHQTVSRMKGGKRVSPIKRVRRVSGVRQGKFVVHRAMDGQSWQVIARAYRTTIAKIRAVNKRLGKRLHVGDSVRVPTSRAPAAVRVANCGYPGIRFVRRDRKRTIRLMTCKGGVSGQGRRLLSKVATRPGEKARKLLHPQLIRRLQRVADEFPGRVFRVVSGYRAPRGDPGASRHHIGRALDFSVKGVSNKALYNLCRQLPSTGCGYYPNSSFIHLDYRSESGHWTDHSGPGQSPDYAPRPAAESTPTIPDPVGAEPPD